MSREVRQLHNTLLDLAGFLNRPQRDAALLSEAGISLDRALFPLLVVIERKGPIGVVDLADFVGRDYTTVSRQTAKLAKLGLIDRRPSRTDSRVRELTIAPHGKQLTRALDAARDRLAATAFKQWSKRDLRTLARLLRRFASDLHALPVP
jgi:DNA-binding MarR family transcriptional regulator